MVTGHSSRLAVTLDDDSIMPNTVNVARRSE